MTRVVLLRAHTHAGRAYLAGERIEVDADAAEWLLAHDIATREPRATTSRTESEAAPATTPNSQPISNPAKDSKP